MIFISVSLFAADKDSLWKKRTDAQIEFQTKMADLLLKNSPELEKLILIHRDLQIVMIEIRKEKYYYLLENKPSQIIRAQGQSQWANFKWTDEDEKGLLELNKKYSTLKDQKEILKQKNQNNPNWPKVREKFSKITKTTEYQSMQKQLMNTFKEIENRLKEDR